LAATPGSRMIVKTTSFGDPPTRALAAERFATLGLPMDRVELLGPERTQQEHLRSYARIDVALDTFPYNGTTTTCEALAMGVPVIALAGASHVSRVGLTLLSAAELKELIARDAHEYVRLAMQLAGGSPRLSEF